MRFRREKNVSWTDSNPGYEHDIEDIISKGSGKPSQPLIHLKRVAKGNIRSDTMAFARHQTGYLGRNQRHPRVTMLRSCAWRYRHQHTSNQDSDVALNVSQGRGQKHINKK